MHSRHMVDCCKKGDTAKVTYAGLPIHRSNVKSLQLDDVHWSLCWAYVGQLFHPVTQVHSTSHAGSHVY